MKRVNCTHHNFVFDFLVMRVVGVIFVSHNPLIDRIKTAWFQKSESFTVGFNFLRGMACCFYGVYFVKGAGFIGSVAEIGLKMYI